MAFRIKTRSTRTRKTFNAKTFLGDGKVLAEDPQEIKTIIFSGLYTIQTSGASWNPI